MTDQYHVRVATEALRFSAAHFITYGQGQVEALHGHDYRAATEIVAPLGPHGYVIDFLAVEQALHDLVRALDHRTLLPTCHPQMQIESRAEEIEVSLGCHRWVFPRAGCVLLPIENTTAEAIARHLAINLREHLERAAGRVLASVRVEVTELAGFTAACTLCSS